MAMEIDAGGAFAAKHVARFAMRWLPWAVLTGLFAAAVWLRHVLPANTDVSWLLTVGERVLDGQQLYRDVIETNPPKAVLVYLPGILIARAFGLPAEIVTDGLVFAAIVLSLGFAASLLRGSSVVAGMTTWPLLLLALIVTAILPMREFGQREHIAILELLPAIAVLALRLTREPPPLWGIVIAGLGLGLALTFKPYFAIAILGALAVQALTLKSWRALFTPEYGIAAGVVVTYVAIVLTLFPDYLAIVVPLARDVYVPTGLTLVEMLQKPVVLPWAIAMVAALLLMRRRPADAPFLMLIVMAAGFAAVFFLQRKGWPYHAFPMLVFALLAFGYAIARTRLDRLMAIGARALLAVLVALTMTAFAEMADTRSLETAIARLRSHPKILVVSAEPMMGHPLTRNVAGTWVSRQQGLWVKGYMNFLHQRGKLDRDRAALLEGYAARERDWLVADVRKTPPDVVLIDNRSDDWGAWVAADADLSSLLAPYARKQTIDGVDILSRPE